MNNIIIIPTILLLFTFDFDSCLLLSVYPIYNAGRDKIIILSNNKGKSGIYMFKNLINGKQYIGSSENLRRRFYEYFSPNYLIRNNSMYICRALRKYGLENFLLEILEYCEPSQCIEREKHFIKLFSPAYNIVQDPTAPPMAGRKHSPETIEKISGENHHMFGKARPLGSGSPSQKVKVFDQKTNKTTTHDSISEAAKSLSISSSSIRSYFCKNQQKPYKNRYIFTKVG
jgi:predicted GIY-YIG superfamily endonuclease